MGYEFCLLCGASFTTIHHMAKSAQENEKDSPRLTISLPRKLYDEVQAIAAKESRSLAWVVRKALENLVAEEQPLFHHTPRSK